MRDKSTKLSEIKALCLEGKGWKDKEDREKGRGKKERRRARKGGARERCQEGTGMQTPWQNWHFYQRLNTFSKKYRRVSKPAELGGS